MQKPGRETQRLITGTLTTKEKSEEPVNIPPRPVNREKNIIKTEVTPIRRRY